MGYSGRYLLLILHRTQSYADPENIMNNDVACWLKQIINLMVFSQNTHVWYNWNSMKEKLNRRISKALQVSLDGIIIHNGSPWQPTKPIPQVFHIRVAQKYTFWKSLLPMSIMVALGIKNTCHFFLDFLGTNHCARFAEHLWMGVVGVGVLVGVGVVGGRWWLGQLPFFGCNSSSSMAKKAE